MRVFGTAEGSREKPHASTERTGKTHAEGCKCRTAEVGGRRAHHYFHSAAGIRSFMEQFYTKANPLAGTFDALGTKCSGGWLVAF